MIGYLTGTINFKSLDSLNLLTGGVGYTVFTPPTTLAKLERGSSTEFFIYTHVREDQLDLYGFRTQEELQFFKILLSVSGIGAKTALMITDRGVESVRKAILNADVDFFTIIPRLGRKNAQKIIIELKNKVGSITELDLTSEIALSTEVVDALVAMGYNRNEVSKALKDLPSNETKVEDQIRFALRSLGKGKV